jgi:rRNA maturation endonuclease Nob1
MQGNKEIKCMMCYDCKYEFTNNDFCPRCGSRKITRTYKYCPTCKTDNIHDCKELELPSGYRYMCGSCKKIFGEI